MNTNQTTPLITMPTPATTNIAPPLLILGVIGFGIFWVLKRFLPDEDKEKKPEAVPANAETESRRKVAETTAFRQIPAEISVKPAAVPVSSAKPFIPPLSVPPVPVVVAIPKIVPQAPPPPIKKKFVTREAMATAFQRGARALSRQDAVAALKKLGFRKTAAYAALSEDGRFASWLQFAPDGTITWTD